MRILITGGFGFLGSHLIDELLTNDPKAQIRVVDNLSSNAIEPLDSVTFDNMPVYDWIKERHNQRFDEVYHLASPVGPVGVLDHSGKIARRIIDDTYAVACAARYWKAKMAFVSTSEVYGGGQGGYCSEENPKIISPQPSARLEYAAGKLAAEVMLQNQVKADGLDCVIIRPFNIAGARQSPNGGFVLPRFLDAIQDDKPLTVYGDGSQVRALTDVRDVAHGLYLAMERGKSGEVYNIGNADNKATIKELAERIIKISGKGSLEYVDPKKLFGDRFVEASDKFPDSTKAYDDLGWSPKYDLDQIIETTIKSRATR